MVNPSHEHIQKSLHIVKYVSSTLKAKITYNTSGGEEFKVQIGEWTKMIENPLLD